MFCHFHLPLPQTTEEHIRRDVEAIFPGEEDVRVFPHDTPLEVMAREAGVFRSSSDSRRAGLRGPAPLGVTAWGTKKKRFFVFREAGPGVEEEEIIARSVFDRTRQMMP